MVWYGSLNKLNLNINRKTKKNNNAKIRKNGINMTSKINFNRFAIVFHFPSNWSALFLKNTKNSENNINIYLFSLYYYFCLTLPISNLIVIYNKNSNTFLFISKQKNYFYNIFWKNFKLLFNSFVLVFFKKLKFKGKGYYIFKNKRNTIALQFGFSHKIYIYMYFISVKFLSKTSVILFGSNLNDLIFKSFELRQKRPYNIFTNKGIRFTRQIIYKKIGKVSSYR